MKFQSTIAENFQSWDKFLDAYYEPIRTALGLIPFIGEGRADDLTQSFFMKLYERDILEKPTRDHGTVSQLALCRGSPPRRG